MWHPGRVWSSKVIDSIKRKASCVPIAFSLILFGAAFFAGLSSGVATSFCHLGPNVIAAAAAISSQVFGLKGHPYEAYKSVLTALEKTLTVTPENFPQNFRNYALVNSTLHSAQSVDIAGSPLVSLPGHDPGTIEYTHAAFLLFGIDVKSLYYFYFVILGLSVTAYLLSFWRDYIACTILFGAACAIYSFMSGFVSNEVQLLSVANSRFLSTLGIIPLLHIAFLVVRGDAGLRWSSIASTVIQASVLSFAYAARATSSWMLLALLVLFGFYLVRAFRPAFKQKTITFLSSVIRCRGLVLLLALTTVGAMYLGRQMLLPSADLYRHPVWHNIFIGFSQSPDWMSRFGKQYDDTEGDAISFTAARKYAQAHHMPPAYMPGIITITDYETVMRSVVIQFIKEHPRFALESFLIYRPLTFPLAMRNFADSVRNSVPAGVFILIFCMCCCIGILGLASPVQGNSLRFWPAVGVLALSFIVSLDSVFVVHSAPALISDQAFLLVAIIVSLSVWTFTKISHSLLWPAPGLEDTRLTLNCSPSLDGHEPTRGSNLDCSPSLDQTAGLFPASSGQRGPYATDRSIRSIGTLLPIAL
jgi:hypothetical protein